MFLDTRVLRQRADLSKASVRRARRSEAARTLLLSGSPLKMGVRDSDDCVAFAWGIERVEQN